ncbi:MAG: hypothetical protein JWO13_279 [Acidobacteriales bacterium]|nr:hypothetical protein [Terriglobales bacterium]
MRLRANLEIDREKFQMPVASGLVRSVVREGTALINPLV